MAWFSRLDSIRARELRLQGICDDAAQYFGPQDWPTVLDFTEQFAALSGGNRRLLWRVREARLRLKLRSPRPERRREQPAAEPLRPQPAVPEGARLVSGRGQIFHLNAGEVRLGRRDETQRIFPHVDLTPENPQRTVHRRHARIFLQDGEWYLAAEPDARNGTFVNRRVVLPASPVPLRDGDRIQLSQRNPVELTFRLAS